MNNRILLFKSIYPFKPLNIKSKFEAVFFDRGNINNLTILPIEYPRPDEVMRGGLGDQAILGQKSFKITLGVPGSASNKLVVYIQSLKLNRTFLGG